jgi:hypothetical protein
MEQPDPTTGPVSAEPPEADDDEDEAGEAEAISLVTLNEILPLSQYAVPVGEWDKPLSDRVRYALDMLLIAACERAARILRSDLEE